MKWSTYQNNVSIKTDKCLWKKFLGSQFWFDIAENHLTFGNEMFGKLRSEFFIIRMIRYSKEGHEFTENVIPWTKPLYSATKFDCDSKDGDLKI